MLPLSVKKLIDQFIKFPTVGPRTASRFVSHLMASENKEIDELLKAICDLKKNIKKCEFCFNPFESSGNSGQEEKFCQICLNSGRDKSLFCIVANETDLMAIEKTKKYKGRYFILGGTVSRLKRADVEKIKIKDLQDRIKNNPEIKEIILAINPTAEGEATALYLERLLKPYNKKITRLGRGLPIGAELEYADEQTLSSAIDGRK